MDVEFNSAVPIYIQIIEEIKRQIVSGERAPGSRIEPVRETAKRMGVNPNTVQRAFSELERDGLMFTERTSGRYITNDEKLIKKVREKSVISKVAEFVDFMRKSGFSGMDIIGIVTEYLNGGKDDERTKS